VQERPILENSTACTMSNAKNLVHFVSFLAVMDAGDSFGIHLNKTKQVSNDLFCQFQTCFLSATELLKFRSVAWGARCAGAFTSRAIKHLRRV